MSLKARIERLEAARSRGAVEILRVHPDGGASLTEILNGRIVSRWDATPERAARLERGAVAIERSYGKECADAA
jgi:hypothetical protein